ncbi:hypothetical protein SprV_0100115000 [Sparganum proliferum]
MQSNPVIKQDTKRPIREGGNRITSVGCELGTAAIMSDLAGFDDVPNCASPRVIIRGSRSGQFNPLSSPTTETEYRRSKSHLHVLTNCVEPGWADSSPVPSSFQRKIEHQE